MSAAEEKKIRDSIASSGKGANGASNTKGDSVASKLVSDMKAGNYDWHLGENTGKPEQMGPGSP